MASLRASLGRASLLRSAMASARAEDLGDWAYDDGFALLLRSLNQEANLTIRGRWALRRSILYALIARLRLVEHRKHNPEWLRKPMPPPIIITGLPRTGTTFLHRLLAQDPQFHAPPLWQLLQPLPRHASDSRTRRRFRFGAEMLFSQPFMKALDSRHVLRASEPEECMFLMAESFCSMLFWTQAPAFSYLDWYKTADRTQKYEDYADLLQALGEEKQLLLKAPEHLGSITHLRRKFPKATIVHTRRDPVTAFASFASLLRTTHSIVSEGIDHKRAARATLDWLSLEWKNGHDESALNIGYDQIVSQPLSAVDAIYEAARLKLTPQIRERMRSFIAANPQNKHGAHEYGVEETGLSEVEIRAALDGDEK